MNFLPNLLLFASITFFALCSYSEEIPKVGSKAPDFNVESGDGKTISLDALKGKVIVLFYDSRDTTNRDAQLREALNKFYDAQSGERKYSCFKLVVINCTAAFFPIDLIWKKKLVEASNSKKMDIYGDWDGKFALDYGLNLDDSNIVIIDKNGIIRYYSRVEISDKNEINKIITLLNEIT